MYAQFYIYNPGAALDTHHKRNLRLNRNVLQTIENVMQQNNPFCELYQCAFEVLKAASGGDENFNVPVYLHYDNSTDHHRYNMPTTDEIVVILPGDGMEISNVRDIIVYRKQEQGLMQISECHPAYLPLHYVLFSPTGQLGWTTKLKHWYVTRNVSTSGKLSMKQYFCYHLFERASEYSPILREGRLFQQFIVDVWPATEQNRLAYARLNQNEFCSDLYYNLTDIVTEGLNADKIGQRSVLPSSHIGSPRNMYEIYQDSLAITRYNKHPYIFLTMTANPNWPEITNALLPNQTVYDWPDLVVRVFELKRKTLLNVVFNNGVFGIHVAHV
ncbi:hypothetical protein GIB67_001520 [Kingdonia uniflora]|uniref:Helitron helicase-like domain-containing protein n=1 Tax=Kingdonia uniflora TaxID=39325 RepID=A0A7J7LZA3_9MAGN|nr:hypothetical protein GIB67_001520 [Kingdonia uniflora]